MAYSFLDAAGSVQTADSSIISGTTQRPILTIGSFLTALPFSPSGNQSVSGTVDIGVSPGSVVAFQGGTRISSISGQVTVVSSISGGIFPIAGSVAATVTNFPGSVAAWLQSSNASIITVGTAAANQSVSGTVQTDVRGSVATVIIGGSIAATYTPPANQSVSGSVGQGTTPWIITGSVQGTFTTSNSSVQVLNFPSNTSVSGAVSISNFPTTQNVSGSVVSFQGAGWSGSVLAVQGGTGITSVYGIRNDAVASFLGADLTARPVALDAAGRTLIRPFAAEEARVEGYNSVVSTSVTTLVPAAGAGLRNYITDLWVANTGASATLVTLKDGAGSVLGYTIAPAGGGSNLPGLVTPIRTGANATFDIQPATATSVLYATVKGFKAP